VPSGQNGSTLWANGCAWDQANNTGCGAGTPTNFGGNFTVNVVANVIAAGTCTVNSMIYDFSNNAYHYNGDYGAAGKFLTVISTAAGATAGPTVTTAATATTAGGGGVATQTAVVVTATAVPATATAIPTSGPSPTPTLTPTGPTPTPTVTPSPTNTPTETPTATGTIGQLPETGSRLHPSEMLPSAGAAANASPVQIGITIAVIITLVMGVALAAWGIMMSYSIVPKESPVSRRVFGALGVMFIVCAVVLAGMLAFNLVRTANVGAPPQPQSSSQNGGGTVALYRPPDIPATRLIIPELHIDTELTEAPRLGSSWDVSQFFDEIAHLEGTAFPGMPGNAILAGHVHHTKGIGPFWNLKNLQPGNMIIAQGKGVEYRYQVEWVKTVTPDDVDVLEATKEPVLTLISCADWSDDSWSYTDRLIVRAKFFDRAKLDYTPTAIETATDVPDADATNNRP
jgi:LPXTG-site transpeptidase (sortase) family protein